MKILILVQSIEVREYPELIKKQKETWDSVEVPDVKTIFYYQDPEKDALIGQDMYIKSNISMHFMFNVFIEALKRSLEFDWDFVFRTDNSTYVNKSLLKEILSTKPTKAYYAGSSYSGKVSKNITRLPFKWGEGIVLSRDIAEFLVNVYSGILPGIYYGADDLNLAKALHKVVEPQDLFVKIFDKENPNIINHVYRCKPLYGGISLDEQKETMDTIHNFLLSEKKKEEDKANALSSSLTHGTNLIVDLH
jgi:hypothetical protein